MSDPWRALLDRLHMADNTAVDVDRQRPGLSSRQIFTSQNLSPCGHTYNGTRADKCRS
jgi:hypothetical protein